MELQTNGHTPSLESNNELRARIDGRATAEGTARFRDRQTVGKDFFHTLGKGGLNVSAVGFGTYRVDHRVALHRSSLAMAVRMGVNLVDTSSNYADGNAERLIGHVVRGLIDHGIARRDELVIVSKGGYIQGSNYEALSKRVDADSAAAAPGSELAELVRYGQGLWHSIHPDFLHDQIAKSLDRLEMETIDVFLLHNPEYYIHSAIRDNEHEEDVRAEYERRIEQAFEQLEREVAAGTIGAYGISSNTFPRKEEAVDRTSLESALRSAERVQAKLGLAEHHFVAVQLPLNIFEPQAVTELNQRKATRSVIGFAREHDIAVLINRPLNAIVGSTLTRLADFPEREHPPEEDISELVHDLALQEQEFKNGPLKDIYLSPQVYDAIQRLMNLGGSLENQWMNFSGLEEWRDVSQTVLAPRIQFCLDSLRPASRADKNIYESLTTYAESADAIMEHITNFYSSKASRRAATIHEAMDALLPEDYKPLSLAQKAVLLIRSVPGVTSVLVGMRAEEYVEDVIYGLQALPVENVEEIWRRLASVV